MSDFSKMISAAFGNSRIRRGGWYLSASSATQQLLALSLLCMAACSLDRKTSAADPTRYASEDAIARVSADAGPGDSNRRAAGNRSSQGGQEQATDSPGALGDAAAGQGGAADMDTPTEGMPNDSTVPPGASPSTSDDAATSLPNDGSSRQSLPDETATTDVEEGAVADDEAPDGEASLTRVCNRVDLEQRADRFLSALSAGSPSRLVLHPDVRYTEDGRTLAMGRGLWRNRPGIMFARHIVDTFACGSLTEAVLTEGVQTLIYGVRLRHIGEQLAEVESFIVRPNFRFYDPEGVIGEVPDPWEQRPAVGEQMSRQALLLLADTYLDSADGLTPPPASSATCERRQNGTLVEGGRCDVRAGAMRFEQRRYPIVDEALGIVSAFTVYDGYLGFYMIKAFGHTIQRLAIVGGNPSNTSGW